MNTIEQGRIPALQAGQYFGSLSKADKGREPVVSTAVSNIQDKVSIAPLTNGVNEDQKEQFQTVGGQTELSQGEKYEVQQMKKRDADVKAHERAHQAAGGQYTGGANFTYELGPDGKRYAVSGEVAIDASAISGDASATADKMRTIITAARAPANPSAQDMMVAQRAQQALMQAQAQLVQERVDTVSAAFSHHDANARLSGTSRIASEAPFEEAATKYMAAHQLVKADYGFSGGTSNTHGYTGSFA